MIGERFRIFVNDTAGDFGPPPVADDGFFTRPTSPGFPGSATAEKRIGENSPNGFLERVVKKKNEIKTYTCIKIKLTSRRRTAMLCFDGVHMRVIITVEICARPKPVCCRPKDVKKKTYALASTLCAILQATSSSPPPPGTERRRGLLGVCNIISHVDFWPAFPRLKRRRKKSPYLPPPHPPD